MQFNYVIVAGHGRSGSNRMLDIFNQHERSWCRNEPNEVDDSALNALPDGFFLNSLPADFVMRWRAQRYLAAQRFSWRDRLPHFRKDWHGHALAPRLGREILSRNRLRRALFAKYHDVATPEWTPPAAYASSNDHIVPVFKILLNQAWMVRTHAHDAGQIVIHNIRAPERFLRSWRGRYVEDIGTEQVYADNLRSIERILAYFDQPAWNHRPFSEANLLESELWRWRYVNETMWTHLAQSPRYHIITYDQVSADPIGVAAKAFAAAGLSMNATHASRIEALRNELFGTPANPVPIDPAMIHDIVARVTDDSPLLPLLTQERRHLEPTMPIVQPNAAKAS